MGQQLEKLETAIIRLLRNNAKVFYASLIMQMVRIEEPKVKTMGVSIDKGRIYLYYAPEFLDELTVDELVSIMEHEVLHLVMEHVFRCKHRQKEMWNVAADIAINQMIDNLPAKKKNPKTGQIEGPLSHKDYNLPENKPAEFYYNALMKDAKLVKIAIGMANGTAGGKGQEQLPGGGKVIDNHDNWNKGNGNKGPSELEKEIVRQAVAEAYEECQKRQGHLPGGLEQAIKEWMKKPEIPWQILLRQFVGRLIKAGHKSSWRRTSRRLGDIARGKVPTRTVKIGLAIDTSGSISTNDFNEFMGEIKGIQSSYKSDITVMECDAAVQKTYTLKPYSKVDTKFKGRGGTDFSPVFEEIDKKKQLTPELLVFFTDLYGSFPKTAPRYPVLWVLCTSSGRDMQKPPFGKVLQLKRKGKGGDND
jgi:predicted metal-dependent peptidase